MTTPEDEPPSHLEAARLRLGDTPAALWWAYFGLGGTATPLEFGAFLSGQTRPGSSDHDRLSCRSMSDLPNSARTAPSHTSIHGERSDTRSLALINNAGPSYFRDGLG